MNRVRSLLLAFAAIAAAVACGLGVPSATVAPTGAIPVATETPLTRATPYSQEPAAGICAEPSGDEVAMRLEPGIPDPRCIIVEAGQHLRVVNHTGVDVTVALGSFSAALVPDGETVFEPSFGDYLMPGVHVLQVDPCCGGELWLKE